MEWTTDRGLQLRIVLVLGFVLALPFAFAYAFLFLANTVGLELLEFATGRPWNGRFSLDPVVLAGVVAVGFLAQYALGDRVALRSAGARRADHGYEDVRDALSRLAAQADLPVPELAVVRSDVPNAFTVGRSPSSATVVVTTGLLETLDADERDAVLAHELAHVKNRDVAVMTLAYFLPSLTYLVAVGAYLLLNGVFHVLARVRHVDDDNAKGLLVVVVVLITSAVLTLLVSAAFWVGSFLLFRLLSRYREYAADRGAAAITGAPAALASALRALDDRMGEVPDADLRERDGGLEALYVTPIDDYQFGSDRELISSDVFPSTHPPTTERIERLRAMTAEAERS